MGKEESFQLTGAASSVVPDQVSRKKKKKSAAHITHVNSYNKAEENPACGHQPSPQDTPRYLLAEKPPKTIPHTAGTALISAAQPSLPKCTTRGHTHPQHLSLTRLPASRAHCPPQLHSWLQGSPRERGREKKKKKGVGGAGE